ncbi:hypothetical protein Moror_6883 [Moniliophthora roreri MCA 2997]|uniref:Uncharacterized protein n=1 Tax=Moniliophthora roreri (strain MCA 2997) TaxID=1381753 RepID=V2XBW9_MONRO|nr:hypothetical protein Moror_6883 [Moniliophthora roreri MCA 2997]
MEHQPSQPQSSLDTPVPLSFPSILRNPGVADRFAHLREPKSNESPNPQRTFKKTKRDDNEGRRWVRRKENATFVGNPHVVPATRKDYIIQAAPLKPTFPEPLPPYLPRSAKLPTQPPPVVDLNSANAGRFSLSLKGMRRDLRKCGYRAEVLVRDIETEIVEWLEAGGTVLAPASGMEDNIQIPGTPIRDTNTVFEVSRTPLKLIWDTSSDGFARYVVHCCARFHNVVSFSKDASGTRLTYLLRPNVTRPDHATGVGIDTPPVTDLDSSSHFNSDSDFLSDRDSHSELGASDIEREPQHRLSTIAERSLTSSPAVHLEEEDKWSVIGGSDIDHDEEEGIDPDKTIEAISPPGPKPLAFRARLQDRRHTRSSSSPSRSPARRALRRPQSGIDSSRKLKMRRENTLFSFVYS